MLPYLNTSSRTSARQTSPLIPRTCSTSSPLSDLPPSRFNASQNLRRGWPHDAIIKSSIETRITGFTTIVLYESADYISVNLHDRRFRSTTHLCPGLLHYRLWSGHQLQHRRARKPPWLPKHSMCNGICCGGQLLLSSGSTVCSQRIAWVMHQRGLQRG